MSTKTKLRDYLRRASHDASLRTELLANAHYSKKLWGWLSLMWGVFLLMEAVFAWRGLSSHYSFSGWAGIIMALMLYDKFGDRVAMLESMDEPNSSSDPATGAAR